MRNAKLWSVLLAAVLLCACVAGVLFVGAGASSGTVIYTVGAVEGGNQHFDDFSAALSAAEDNQNWADTDVLEIQFSGSIDGGEADGILFGQKTIFKANGEKLQIILKGVDDAAITLPEGRIACANDYVFENLTLPVGNSKSTQFFAGSGEVSFENVSFGTGVLGYLFADTFTQAVFEDWADLEEGEYVETSLSFGAGASYASSSNYRVAAVGGNSDNFVTVAGITIMPEDMRCTVAVDVSTAIFGGVNGRFGSLITDQANIVVNSGTVYGVCMAGTESKAGKLSESRSGDVNITLNGGTVASKASLLMCTTFNGDATFEMTDGTVNTTLFMQGAAGTVNGDLTLKISGGTVGAVYGGAYGATSVINGNVRNEITGGIIGDNTWGFCGMRVFSLAEGFLLENIISGTEEKPLQIKGSYYGAGRWAGIVTDRPADMAAASAPTTVSNEIDGEYVTFTKNFYGGSAGVPNGTDAVVEANIINKLTNCTLTGSYYGGNSTDNNNTNKVIGNIENTIIGGSYVNISGGSLASTKISTIDGNITNTIKGDVTISGIFGGSRVNDESSKYATVTGKITNTVETLDDKEPKFTTTKSFSYYGGGHFVTVGGGIENIIKAGTFNTMVQCGVFKVLDDTTFGKIVDTDYSIINRISGGTFNGHFYGGFASTGGEISGGIYNEISGGIFANGSDDRISFANRATVMSESNPIVTKITSGTFNAPVYMANGGYSTASGGDVAVVESIIEGGTFECEVYAGAYGTAAVTDTCKLTITGGVFKSDVVADSSGDAEAYDVTLTLSQTEGKNLEIYGEVAECTKFEGSDGTVKIGKDTVINAAAASGSVTLHQTEGWLGHDYFAAPENSITVSVTEEDGVYGKYSYDPTVLLVKGGYTLAGTTLIFEERVGIRVLFNKDDVAAYENIFSYAVAKDGAEAFLTGTELETWKDPATGKEYDSFIIHGIGLSDFAENFTVSAKGLEDTVFSVYELAEAAEASWTDNAWKAFAVAIQNLNDVYSAADGDGVHDEAQYSLNPVTRQTSLTTPEGVSLEGIVQQNSMYASLLMSDAVGVKLTFTLADGYTLAAPVIKVNGREIEGALAVDGQNVTITLLFNAKYMAAPFEIQVANGETVLFTLSSSIEKLAYDLAMDENNSSRENARALLYYIQKAVAVVGA